MKERVKKENKNKALVFAYTWNQSIVSKFSSSTSTQNTKHKTEKRKKKEES